MFGYATNEHESLMPLSYVYSTLILRKINELMNNKTLTWVRPDAKSQVTIEYEETENGLKALRVDTVLISCQHNPDVT